MSLEDAIATAAATTTDHDLQRAATAEQAVARMYGDNSDSAQVKVVKPLVMQKHGRQSEAF